MRISWVVVLMVNPSIYLELITFCISEWLAAFSFVMFFYFFVSFDKALETLLRRGAKYSNIHHVVLVQNVMWYL